jgi:hypothetical protein
VRDVVMVVALACAAQVGCRDVAAAPPTNPPPVVPRQRPLAEVVSLVQVLAAPGSFHNKRIQVKGYLHLQFEGDALYLHKEDFDHGITKNALWVSVPERWARTPDGYVIIEAVVDSTMQGHMGMFQASLKDVSRLDRLR